jgi:hypothetical protein
MGAQLVTLSSLLLVQGICEAAMGLAHDCASVAFSPNEQGIVAAI